MDINTDEINEYITATTKSIVNTRIDLRTEKQKKESDGSYFEEGDHRYYLLDSQLDFEISVVIQKTGKGKMSILVADIGGSYKKEIISKIKFKIDSLSNQHQRKTNERRAAGSLI